MASPQWRWRQWRRRRRRSIGRQTLQARPARCTGRAPPLLPHPRRIRVYSPPLTPPPPPTPRPPPHSQRALASTSNTPRLVASRPQASMSIAPAVRPRTPQRAPPRAPRRRPPRAAPIARPGASRSRCSAAPHLRLCPSRQRVTPRPHPTRHLPSGTSTRRRRRWTVNADRADCRALTPMASLRPGTAAPLPGDPHPPPPDPPGCSAHRRAHRASRCRTRCRACGRLWWSIRLTGPRSVPYPTAIARKTA